MTDKVLQDIAIALFKKLEKERLASYNFETSTYNCLYYLANTDLLSKLLLLSCWKHGYTPTGTVVSELEVINLVTSAKDQVTANSLSIVKGALKENNEIKRHLPSLLHYAKNGHGLGAGNSGFFKLCNSLVGDSDIYVVPKKEIYTVKAA